ncbi:hypothetical protein A2U01_0093522, partial [Trifolium medium]|nr:hypothetical protein [Trifolium medium]
FVVSSPDLDFDLGSVSLRLGFGFVIKCNLLALKDRTHGFPLICLLVLFYCCQVQFVGCPGLAESLL